MRLLPLLPLLILLVSTTSGQAFETSVDLLAVSTAASGGLVVGQSTPFGMMVGESVTVVARTVLYNCDLDFENCTQVQYQQSPFPPPVIPTITLDEPSVTADPGSGDIMGAGLKDPFFAPASPLVVMICNGTYFCTTSEAYPGGPNYAQAMVVDHGVSSGELMVITNDVSEAFATRAAFPVLHRCTFDGAGSPTCSQTDVSGGDDFGPSYGSTKDIYLPVIDPVNGKLLIITRYSPRTDPYPPPFPSPSLPECRRTPHLIGCDLDGSACVTTALLEPCQTMTLATPDRELVNAFVHDSALLIVFRGGGSTLFYLVRCDVDGTRCVERDSGDSEVTASNALFRGAVMDTVNNKIFIATSGSVPGSLYPVMKLLRCDAVTLGCTETPLSLFAPSIGFEATMAFDPTNERVLISFPFDDRVSGPGSSVLETILLNASPACGTGEIFVWSNGTCETSCPLGQGKSVSECVACGAGTLPANDPVSFPSGCSPCPPGLSCDGTSTTECGPGRASPGSAGGECPQCPAGSVPSQDRSSCETCARPEECQFAGISSPYPPIVRPNPGVSASPRLFPRSKYADSDRVVDAALLATLVFLVLVATSSLIVWAMVLRLREKRKASVWALLDAVVFRTETEPSTSFLRSRKNGLGALFSFLIIGGCCIAMAVFTLQFMWDNATLSTSQGPGVVSPFQSTTVFDMQVRIQLTLQGIDTEGCVAPDGISCMDPAVVRGFSDLLSARPLTCRVPSPYTCQMTWECESGCDITGSQGEVVFTPVSRMYSAFVIDIDVAAANAAYRQAGYAGFSSGTFVPDKEGDVYVDNPSSGYVSIAVRSAVYQHITVDDRTSDPVVVGYGVLPLRTTSPGPRGNISEVPVPTSTSPNIQVALAKIDQYTITRVESRFTTLDFVAGLGGLISAIMSVGGIGLVVIEGLRQRLGASNKVSPDGGEDGGGGEAKDWTDEVEVMDGGGDLSWSSTEVPHCGSSRSAASAS